MRANKKATHKPHQIDITGDIAKLTAYNKKGNPVVALFDAADIEKVRTFANWRAVWDSKFDTAVIESKDFANKHAVRTPVAAAIMQCSPNAPIHYINGNVLDNRQSNLKIYDLKSEKNEFTVMDDIATVVTKNRCGVVTGEFLIDRTDLDLVVNQNHIWLKKRRSSGQPYVVNIDGLLLGHYLFGDETGIIAYKNLDPLDNRRENISLSES